MVNVKISDLTTATIVAVADVLPLVQGGVTKKTPLSLLPVSTAQAAADAAVQAAAIQRANHTGTQSADTVTDGTTNKAYTGTERTKLAGIAPGATANRADTATDAAIAAAATAQAAADAATYLPQTNGQAPQAGSLPATFAKLATIKAGAPAHLKVLNLGDSYTQKLWGQVAPYISRLTGGLQGARLLGTHGVTVNSSSTVPAPTDNLSDYDAWFSGLTTTFTAGASRVWGQSGFGFTGDTAKVHYIVEDTANGKGGGTFKVQIDGVDATGYTSVSTSATTGATPTLGTITITGLSTSTDHTIGVVGLTGKVRIVGTGYVNTAASGFQALAIGQGGISLDDAVSTPGARATLQAFLTDYQPDLITFEMKELSTYTSQAGSQLTSGLTYRARLDQLLTVINAASPTADFIGIGSPPVASGGSPINQQDDQLIQNSMLKAACQAAGKAYYDTYSLFKPSPTSTAEQDYARLTALGWNGDGTHVTNDADLYRGLRLLSDLGILTTNGYHLPFDVHADVLAADSSITVGKTATAPVFQLTGDPSFDVDAYLYLKRQLRVRTVGSSSDALVIDARGGAGNPSALPQYTQFGSGLAGFAGSSATQVDARANQGGGMAHPADIAYRTAIPATHDQTTSGAITASLADGGVHFITLTGNITSFEFTDAVTGGQEVEVHFIQDATGGRTLSGASGWIGWSGGTPPTLTTTANRRDVFRFRVNGGAYWEIGRSMNVG